ncbi:hypothetical protein ACEWY4_023625 [Coilia grayii]|uniref:Uncharacterized protein n=1 Tax=Coilia grayii TaxID=363190 RepID=A0ABD1IY02_9TELE
MLTLLIHHCISNHVARCVDCDAYLRPVRDLPSGVGGRGSGLPSGVVHPGNPTTKQDERGILEVREERRLAELAGRDSTEVISLKEKVEFTPRAVLERNRPEKFH